MKTDFDLIHSLFASCWSVDQIARRMREVGRGPCDRKQVILALAAEGHTADDIFVINGEEIPRAEIEEILS